jgi:hypothetical protein
MQVFNPAFTTRNANNELVVVIGRQDDHINPFKGFKVGNGGNIMSWKANELSQVSPLNDVYQLAEYSPLVLTDNATGASVHPVTFFAGGIDVKDMQNRDVTMHFHVQGDDHPWKGCVSSVSSRMVSFKDIDMQTVPALAQGTAYTATAETEVVNVFNPPCDATVRRTGAQVRVYLEVPSASNPFKALKSNGKMTGYTASELVFVS